MLTTIHPKLPMRNKSLTKAFYTEKLGFRDIGAADYPDYLILQKDTIEIHFFRFPNLNPTENYGQVYIRTTQIEAWYQNCIKHNVMIHPNGALQIKPWQQIEFSILDPDNNLLTFGESIL